jgi:5,6,7,8-tetrahydromethanopterin hydro-lyase
LNCQLVRIGDFHRARQPTADHDLDHKALFDVHREATAKVIKKAMGNEPTIDWLLENQVKVAHYFHQLGLKGEL